MFRGGRVDGRGTGIASGLGYAKGGSVQDRPGYGLGGALLGLGSLGMKYGIRPAMKYGKKLWQSKLNPLQDPFIKYPAKYGIGAPAKGAYKLTKAAPYSVIGGGTAAELMDLDPTEGTTEGWIGRTWDKGKELWEDKEEIWDEYNPFAEEPQGREFVGEEAEIVGDPRDLPTEKETMEQIIARLEAKNKKEQQELIDLMTPQKLTKEEKLAKMKENKEMIRELYGSGRGKDASRMLLTAASRLLEPGATVKSGFAKALGDEAKVESKRIKYDEAAASAAVNSFLTGEKDYDSLMKQMAIIKYGNRDKLDIAAQLEKDKTWADLWGESKESSTTKKNKNVSQQWLDKEKIDKFVKETNSKKVPTEDLFIEANVGEYYIDQHTGEFFKIIRLEDGTIGKVRKG
tara:strand:- start:140 stop:1342 length:1203 start_codon:yes stop_codon:yes gene_type:complete